MAAKLLHRRFLQPVYVSFLDGKQYNIPDKKDLWSMVFLFAACA
jgi:hypothetical protein